MSYTLIAYRPSGTNICMGHVMERWDSEFIKERGLTRQVLIQRIARLHADDQIPDTYGKWKEILWYEHGDDDFDLSHDIDRDDILAEAADLTKRMVIEDTESRARLAEGEKQRMAALQKAQDIKRLNELRAKYPED